MDTTPQQTSAAATSFGSAMKGSFKGMFMGVLIVFVSLGLLFWNEGRVNLKNIAKKAEIVDLATDNVAELDGELIASQGIVESTETLNDMFIDVSPYLAFNRRIEMFAWEEVRESTAEGEAPRYRYEQVWTSHPEASHTFAEPDGHENPVMSVESMNRTVEDASIAGYAIDMEEVNLPAYTGLALQHDMFLPNSNMPKGNSDYIFLGEGSLDRPDIGDMRVSYSVLEKPLEDIIVFAQLDTQKKALTSFVGKRDTELYRVLRGNYDDALELMDAEHSAIGWLLRIVGFGLLFLGIRGVFGPIQTLVARVPFLGAFTRFGISVFSFLLTAILGGFTVLVSAIIHNVFLFLLLVAVIGVWGYKRMQKSNTV